MRGKEEGGRKGRRKGGRGEGRRERERRKGRKEEEKKEGEKEGRGGRRKGRKEEGKEGGYIRKDWRERDKRLRREEVKRQTQCRRMAVQQALTREQFHANTCMGNIILLCKRNVHTCEQKFLHKYIHCIPYFLHLTLINASS